jgi:adenylate cyclase
MPSRASNILRFDRFTLDRARSQLRVDDSVIELRPKSFDVLCYLVENTDRLVTKDEIARAVWRKVIVTDESLLRCISDVRRALGDAGQRIVQTIPRRGYIFTAQVSDLATPAGTPLLPDLPSLAVLPFANRSDDPQQEYFADGITEDLITSLSKFAGLSVIACYSAFRYRGTDLDVRQIGRELGVRYLLLGSIRRDKERARITARLVDTENSAQLWAEHYDRELPCIFAVQDEVTQKIVGTLTAHISRSELERALAKPPEAFSAYDYLLRGNAIMRSWQGDASGETLVAARSYYERAIAADQAYSPPVCGLALTCLAAWIEPYPQPTLAPQYQNSATLDHALKLAQRAVELDPNYPDAHAMLGGILKWFHRQSESTAEYEKAFALNPNLADYRYGLALIHWGRTEEGMEYLTRIIRLDPFHPPACLTFLGNAYYQAGRYEEALEHLRTAARRLPSYRATHVWLAATAGQLGLDQDAQQAAAVVLHRDPAFTIRNWLELHRFAKQADAERMAEGLRKAHFPE